MSALRVLVLGPIDIELDARLVPVGGQRARSVLAALVIGLCHSVSDDRLMQAVWGDHPPRTAHASLQSHISRLRSLLGDEAIVRQDHSYTLDLDPDQVDACEFERAYRKAAELVEVDPVAAVEACQQALQLWRGPPFGDLFDAEFARPESVRLEELRIDTTELLLEATIAAGSPGLIVPALHAAVADHPYREKLWYLLMRALAHEGRRVEALRSFQEARVILGEAGLEPTIDLRELEAQIHDEDASVRPHLAS